MKKVLITGVNGFVGGYLAKELIDNGYEVFGLDRSGEVKNEAGVRVFKVDILDEQALEKIIEKLQPMAIFHLAAQASPSLSFKQPRLTFEVNLLGTLNLLEIVRKMKKESRPRLVIIGSADEYGMVDPGACPVDEKTSFTPLNPYSVSKVAVYYLSRQYVRSYDLDLVYASSFPHIGPEQREGFFVPDMCVQIVRIENGMQKPVIYTGDLSAIRDYSDVRDIVRGYRLLMEKGKSGERYNLCSGRGVKVSAILDSLLSMSKLKIDHEYDATRMRPSDVPVLYGTFAKVKRDTGWKPVIGLEKSLKDILDWWRENSGRK